jgi:hypothetical protein
MARLNRAAARRNRSRSVPNARAGDEAWSATSVSKKISLIGYQILFLNSFHLAFAAQSALSLKHRAGYYRLSTTLTAGNTFFQGVNHWHELLEHSTHLLRPTVTLELQ